MGNTLVCLTFTALVFATIALFASAVLWGLYLNIFSLPEGILVRSAVIPLSGLYEPADNRIFLPEQQLQNYSSIVNGTWAREAILQLPVRQLNWTNEWLAIVNRTEFDLVTQQLLSESMLFSNSTLGPQVQAILGSDLWDILPQAAFNVSRMPTFNVLLSNQTENLQSFTTVCIYQLLLTLISAFQEQILVSSTPNCTQVCSCVC